MPEDDSRLLKAARQGDEAAFLALYHRYRTPLFRFAWRLTGSIPSAEDIIQECFLVLLRGAAYAADRASLRQYLFGITRNLAMQKMRVGERDAEELEDLELTSSPLDDLLSLERSEAVAQAVAALPPLQREALILFEYEEMSLEEIATISAVEVGAVKARLHRARETLRRRLAPLFGPARTKEIVS
jgi:RNA polymerase sigma-70 factor (ECF subfamily)